jgi:acyl-CoA synthetase (AMP-forming)/AMP-acid ligase II
MQNIGSLLTLNASRYPENIAMRFRDEALSYLELNQRANRLAHGLLSLGVAQGDRVGLMFYNSPQFVALFFATVKIGAVAVPINFRLTPHEVQWTLDSARCKVFAYGAACAAQVDPIIERLSHVQHIICSGDIPPSGTLHFETWMVDGDINEPDIAVGFEDQALVMFTGGSTGAAKAAVHTHKSALFTWISSSIKLSIHEPDEVTLIQVPMFHFSGLNLMCITLLCGGTMVVLERLDPVEILALIHKTRITTLFLAPPAIYIGLLDVPDFKAYDTSSVRRLMTGLGAFSKTLMLRMFDGFFNARLMFAYGLSETGALGCANWITREMLEKDVPHVTSVGREYPLVEMRLEDHKGESVAVGEVGEAIIRSPSNMLEYADQPELTAQTIRDGWIHTGDLLKKDKDGYFYFVDRKKDMIKSGGENVFAQEVETVIQGHPAVQLCAVIGVPDPRFGEAVMAIIQTRSGFQATEQEIIDHCKGSLASYKKPRRVSFVDCFPVNDAGKVQKYKLREQYGKPKEEIREHR